MTRQNQDNHQENPEKGFWKSRSGIFLLVALGVGALLLVFENRLHILGGNGFLALLLLGSVVMHLFMHGGRGGNGGGDKRNDS